MIEGLGKSHLTALTQTDGSRFPGVAAQSLVDGLVCIFDFDVSADTLGQQVLFKLSDAIVHLILSLLQLVLGHFVVLLSLSKVEFKLSGLSGAFHLHVCFPILNALRQPLLHEAGISLQLVDLDATHFLLFARVTLHVCPVGTLSHRRLSIGLLFKLDQVSFEVNIFLGAVKFAQSLFKESVAHFIVLGLGDCDALGRLIVAESARLGYD